MTCSLLNFFEPGAAPQMKQALPSQISAREPIGAENEDLPIGACDCSDGGRRGLQFVTVGTGHLVPHLVKLAIPHPPSRDRGQLTQCPTAAFGHVRIALSYIDAQMQYFIDMTRSLTEQTIECAHFRWEIGR